MKNLKVYCCVMLVMFLLGCTNTDRWIGSVYPDRQNLLIQHSAGAFHSLEKCETACMHMLKSMNADQKGYYECGKNCKSGSSVYEKNCEEQILGNYYK